jgi:ribonuclease T1
VCAHGISFAPEDSSKETRRMKSNLRSIRAIAWFSTIAMGAALVIGCRDAQPEAVPARPEATPEAHTRQPDGSEATAEDGQPRGRILHLPAGVPAKVGKVLRYIDEYQRPAEGYEGSRPFGNHEGLLPKRDAQGRPIRYQEWDVNPKAPGKNRGPERLVTGSDGSAYYTPDHYRSFIKIR